MGAGAFIEPLVVVSLLFGGTWVNRNTRYRIFNRHGRSRSPESASSSSLSSDYVSSAGSSPRSSTSLLDDRHRRRVSSNPLLADQDARWRKREIRVLGWRKEVVSPDTRRFRGNFLSRLLRKFPFLVEAWYWALIYWVYQLGRAFTAVTLVESTVDVARQHALQIIHLEQRLHIFFELPIQHWFLRHPLLMHWTNRIYSFIHIPGTILFLIGLYYYTTSPFSRTSAPLLPHSRSHRSNSPANTPPAAGPKLYAARRRTMAVCNLVAFIVFTLWPCMPPRLLSDPDVPGAVGKEARRYGFVDTVHGKEGESSVWTQNKFCNQYAAMPSLHFGYSLLIGLTIMTLPLSASAAPQKRFAIPVGKGRSLRLRVPGFKRVLCLTIGIAYPALILAAIIATANHFVLDAVAGAMVCGVAWTGNRCLLNLLVVEDWFLWCVRIHKPVRWEGGARGEDDDCDDEDGDSRGVVKGDLVV